jgi:hypothetical protein
VIPILELTPGVRVETARWLSALSLRVFVFNPPRSVGVGRRIAKLAGGGAASPENLGSAGASGTWAHAVLVPASVSRASSAIACSRILYFCTLPLTVIGHPSVTFQ